MFLFPLLPIQLLDAVSYFTIIPSLWLLFPLYYFLLCLLIWHSIVLDIDYYNSFSIRLFICITNNTVIIFFFFFFFVCVNYMVNRLQNENCGIGKVLLIEVLMATMELRKKIFAFRDFLDLPASDASASLNQVSINPLERDIFIYLFYKYEK